MGFNRILPHLTYLLFFMSGFSYQQAVEQQIICGLNSYPQYNGSCRCIPGFLFLDSNTHSKGWYPDPLQQLRCDNSSGSAQMKQFVNINWPSYGYATFSGVNWTECEQSCMEDCLCTVAIYSNPQQQCWKKSMPLPGGRADNSSIAFVKVSTAMTVPLAAPPKQRKKENGKLLTVIGITLISCSFVFGAVLLLIWLCTCRNKSKALQEYQKFDPIGLRAFSYEEIDSATRGFRQEIGRGAFGKVYRGVLSDGREIAVKRLGILVKDGEENGEKEFRTEMGIIGGSHHKNLVKLYGFCHEGFQRLLVYEYMANGSLDSVLFKGSTDLINWEVRVQIALGIARGLLYLHEECTAQILHCDIKPQNILLDENYHAKISDFGISKLIGAEQTRTFTVARGTIGYIAPEWQKCRAVTVKVDVYSFGVMLLEIICCRKMFELNVPDSEMVLSDWAYDCFKYGRLVRLVEQQDCINGIEPTQLERMVLTGLWCVEEDPNLRPSMKNVVQMLEGTVGIRVPPRPASSFYEKSANQLSVVSSLGLSM